MTDIFHRRMTLEHIAVQTWESLLEEGHDRLGTLVRRTQFAYDDAIGYAQRMPLRYNLKPNNGQFEFSKSQRKLLRDNAKLDFRFANAVDSAEKHALFERWYMARFGYPESLGIWFKQDTPIRSFDLLVYKNDKLIACSNFDLTDNAQYSSVAFYDPDEKALNLGTWTMLKEMELGLKNNKLFHYPGYAYMESSKFNYKKTFPNTEFYDWYSRSWQPLSNFDSEHREQWEIGANSYYSVLHQQEIIL